MFQEFKLKNLPEDGITAVKYGPNSNNYLVASSWDCSVRLYDPISNTLRTKYTHTRPVLDCCFQTLGKTFSGGLDNTVRSFDIQAGVPHDLGHHDDAVRCVEFAESVNQVVTGGWDSYVKLWDPRSNTCTSSAIQPGKVYTLSIVNETLVVGTENRKVMVWDLRNMSYVQQRRESNLRFQTRCIRCFPNGQGFVLSSIEGRVAVEFLDISPEAQKKKYAFKCHRNKEDGMENIYPVNAISFHKKYNTFATGGSDGFVNIWDGVNKKRLCQFHKYPTGVTSLCFSDDGTYLAIAVSFNYETEEIPQPKPEDAIFIRQVSEQETKPKRETKNVAFTVREVCLL
ncbi:unnamed protein product, partial [Cyprideis torosa]